MASNTGKSKRDPIKWVRDAAKSAYKKQTECFICGSKDDLELHHTHGLTNLFEKWAKENNIDIDSDESVVDVRDDFIDLHRSEIYDEVFTLCLKHHRLLHSIYGKSPELHTAKKQTVWIEKQKDKINGLVNQEPSKHNKTKAESSAGTNSEGGWLHHRVNTGTNLFTSFRTV